MFELRMKLKFRQNEKIASFNIVSKLISLPKPDTWTNCTITYRHSQNKFHILDGMS